ncbi:MAG TPA: divergent polysaccharide deacetylase family protein [Thermoanaerobaculia bacterium]|nr:divergent polysaccharide deacetylase family protein [Thermoanaerobaculia bacterium]
MAGWEGRRRISPRQKSFRTIALLMLIPVVGLLAILIGIFIAQSRPVLTSRFSVLSPARPRRTENRQPRTRGKIVLIIDDVGFDHQPIDAAMRIDPNINFSILPNARRALEDANLLHDRGFEVLCHLPMEPEQFPRVSPGEGAVLTSMSDDEITRTTAAGLQAVPYARGVNNHMGSRATADRRVMESVLDALPAGMYFVDSRTTGSSVAAAVARERRVRTASRNVFLDDVPNETAVRQQLRALAREADAHGVAIGIGHMYPATVRVLTSEVPVLKRQGFRFVRASEAVR